MVSFGSAANIVCAFGYVLVAAFFSPHLSPGYTRGYQHFAPMGLFILLSSHPLSFATHTDCKTA